MASKTSKKPGDEEELDDEALSALADMDDDADTDESEWEDGGGDTDEEEDF